MTIIKTPIKLSQIQSLATARFGNLVKAVIDIDKKIMAIDAELHADEEALLIQKGSLQANLWGINLYPEKFNTPEFIELDSMINLRPSQNNLSRGVEDKNIQSQIIQIVNQLIVK